MNLKDRARGKYFKISGFEQFEKDDIWLRTKKIKQVFKQQRDRRRLEKWGVHLIQFTDKAQHNIIKRKRERKTKGQKLSEQIANGFKVAKKWRKENQQK